MALFSNRHIKVIAGSVVIFVIFFVLMAQPSGMNSAAVNKPSRLDTSPDINTPETVPISDKAPYEQTKGKVSNLYGSDDAVDDVAPIKESTPKAPAAGGNKIQANKDKSESAEEGRLAEAHPDITTGSSSFANDEDDTSKLVADGSCSGKDEYVVMIDAGSTGSRVHIYSFDLCYSPPKLLNEEFKMLDPGLSSFDTDAVGAAKSLDPLLDLAMETVPKDKRSCTPVAVKATAGLRKLGTEKSEKILKEVRRHLEEDYPFAVVEGDGVSVMDGSDEGVYAWITTNYLLGNIGSAEELPTAAVFDLGGGSTQIVFEPKNGEKMLEGEHKYEIAFGGRKFTLYQYSHLGYGLMEARNKVNAYVLSNYLQEPGATALEPLTATELADKSMKAQVSIENPCIPPESEAENVYVTIDESTYLVTFVSPSKSETELLADGAGTQCRFIADNVLNKDLECASKSCSFNGIYQPSLLHQFEESNDMFIFSYFYDRLNPLGMPNSFTLSEMKEITKLVCSGSKFWSQSFSKESGIAELQKEPQWCLDLSYMVSLLHTGYDIPLEREVKTAKKINNNELGWCLGASLPLLEKDSAGWTCKVEDVTGSRDL